MARNFSPMFPVSLVEKDMGYAVDMARTLGVEALSLLPLRKSTQKQF